jgi:hypothetical protein
MKVNITANFMRIILGNAWLYRSSLGALHFISNYRINYLQQIIAHEHLPDSRSLPRIISFSFIISWLVLKTSFSVNDYQKEKWKETVTRICPNVPSSRIIVRCAAFKFNRKKSFFALSSWSWRSYFSFLLFVRFSFQLSLGFHELLSVNPWLKARRG